MPGWPGPHVCMCHIILSMMIISMYRLDGVNGVPMSCRSFPNQLRKEGGETHTDIYNIIYWI